MRLVLLLLVLGISGGSNGTTAAHFDPSVAVASSSTIASGTGSSDWQGRGYITRRTDDVLVMVYRIGSGHNTNDAALAIRFSGDNGTTWTAANTTIAGGAVGGFPMNPPVGNISYGEGVPLTAPNGDLLIEMWSVDGISSTGTLLGTYQSRSTDGGSTWSTPAAVTFASNPAADTSTFMSDDWFVFDRVIYMIARWYQDGDGVPSSLRLMKSTNNGTSWSYVSTIVTSSEGTAGALGGQEAGMEYVGNSTIVTMIRDNAHTASYRRISTDMGATWGTLDNVTSTVGIAARQKLYTRSHLQGLGGWWKDPVLVMEGFVHQNPPSSQTRRNAVWFSPDRGTTWDGPHYIDVSVEDAGYGDIFWNGSGYSVVNYQGTLLAASLKQYNLTVNLAP